MGEAKKAMDADMKRLRDEESPRAATQRALAYLRLQSYLGEPPDAEVVEAYALRSLDPDLPAFAVARMDSFVLRFPSSDARRTEAVTKELLDLDVRYPPE